MDLLWFTLKHTAPLPCAFTPGKALVPQETPAGSFAHVPASWSDFVKRLSFFGLVAASTSGTGKQQPSLRDY